MSKVIKYDDATPGGGTSTLEILNTDLTETGTSIQYQTGAIMTVNEPRTVAVEVRIDDSTATMQRHVLD